MLENFPLTPKTELDHRISSLQQHLARQQIDGALILQNTDLFYFSGTTQQAHLYVPAAGRPLLMVRKNLERARSESALATIVKVSSPKELGGLIRDAGLTLPGRLGLELDVLPASLYLNYSRIFKNSCLVDISGSIRLIRSIKSGYELECIRRSAAMAAEVAASVKGLIREGMTEIELAGLVEAEARKRGHQGVVRMRLFGGELFYGHLMSGPAAALASCLASPTGGAGLSPAVPQGAGLSRIRAHEPILMDYVFARNGYLADQTRIFALKGLPPELVSAHQAMLELQEELQVRAKPGVRAGGLYDFAVQWTRDRGYADCFMGADSERIRFIGHGIGLELDEFPFLAKAQEMRLEQNMVIALEPKLIIPGKGVVGIEDTHLVTPGGLERLTFFDQQIQVID
ncbi:MAG: M24 family metallopeptidase [Thermodesulfobacteriota bacterium]